MRRFVREQIIDAALNFDDWYYFEDFDKTLNEDAAQFLYVLFSFLFSGNICAAQRDIFLMLIGYRRDEYCQKCGGIVIDDEMKHTIVCEHYNAS